MNTKMSGKLMAALCVAGCAVGFAWAGNDAPAAKPAMPALVKKMSASGEAGIRTALKQIIPNADAVESVRKTSYSDFYEVVLNNGDIVYVDPTGSFLISGALVDLKSKRNVTSERMKELQQINVADLPLTNAIKQVRGNGKRILVTFEDPNCVFCKKLAKEMTSLKDTTIYTFMIPILAKDSAEKSDNIWCSSDRAKAWNDWMVDGKLPNAARCDTPTMTNGELARKLRINGTPTMFVADGSRLGGYVALAELEKAITDATEHPQTRK